MLKLMSTSLVNRGAFLDPIIFNSDKSKAHLVNRSKECGTSKREQLYWKRTDLYPPPELKPRSSSSPAGGDAEHFYYDDQTIDPQKQKSVKQT